MSETFKERIDYLVGLSENLDENEETILKYLDNETYVEIAEFLSFLNENKRFFLFTKIKKDIIADVFCEFNTSIQNEIYNELSKNDFVKIFISCPSESRADFYKQLEYKEQVKLLPFLPRDIKNDVLSLSFYSDETAGGIMSTDFATLFKNMNVEEALLKLKKDAPSQKMLYYAYVVDDNMKMIGFVSLPDLILAERTMSIECFIHNNFISALVNQNKETVCSMIEKYSLVALPILNEEGQLVGIIRYDDAISVIKKEQTEDFEKLMGIVSNDDTEYLQTSCYKNFYQRILWIIGLFCFGVFTSLAIGYYEDILAKIPFLALFFPMISAVGGNVGSQTSSIIVRALSLNEISVKDFKKVFLKEMEIAIFMSVTMFVLSFCEVFIISYIKDIQYKYFIVALGVSVALFFQIFFAIIIGVTLPIFVKFCNKDPAVVATPAITTIVDVSGIFIYFLISTKFINYFK